MLGMRTSRTRADVNIQLSMAGNQKKRQGIITNELQSFDLQF